MMKKVPKRRFKGFLNAGDWEQRKLKSIANMIVTGGDIDKNKIKESGTYPVIANALSKDGIVGYYDDSYRIEAPAVTVTGRGDIGVAKARHQNFTPVVRLLSLTTAHDVDFVEYAINNLKIVSESTGVPQLTVPQLSNYKIHITSIIEERKIGLFISKLDNLITLHQRKLEKLQATKKALLYELFPIENSRRPKRRFKGFTGDWEQRKLLTVLNKIVDYRGRTPKKLGLDWSPTGHLALSALNVKMGYVDKTVDAHYGDDHLYSVWMKDNDLYEGQVLFTTEAPMGNVAQVPDDNKYILSQRTIAFVPDRRVISDNFLAVVLSASKCQKSLINRASGGTAKGVSQKTLSEISLDIPRSLSEQDKVSELINKLSKIITLHQRKLEKLKNLKAAYLNEMFV